MRPTPTPLQNCCCYKALGRQHTPTAAQGQHGHSTAQSPNSAMQHQPVLLLLVLQRHLGHPKLAAGKPLCRVAQWVSIERSNSIVCVARKTKQKPDGRKAPPPTSSNQLSRGQ